MPIETRHDGRGPEQLRPARIVPSFLSEPAGSALIEMGKTHVLCTASVVPGVPPFLEGSNSGWLTAEYAMLPGSTDTRKSRGPDGRAREIGRLVGRALRASVDLGAWGPRTVFIDCDVLQAHGGTRTASVTGAWVALALAARKLEASGDLSPKAVPRRVAAVSVGLVGGRAVLDLDREEDRAASADVNVVMNDRGRFIEIQGTAEKGDFSEGELSELLALAGKGIRALFEIQDKALEEAQAKKT